MFHKNNVFCDALDVDTAGTVYSDIIDTGAANVGDVEPLVLELRSEAAAAGSGTLDITLQSSDSEGFSTAIDEVVIPQKNKDGLAKGVFFTGTLPYRMKRYLRLKFVVTTGFTSGTALVTGAIRARF